MTDLTIQNLGVSRRNEEHFPDLVSFVLVRVLKKKTLAQVAHVTGVILCNEVIIPGLETIYIKSTSKPVEC